ncbi:hypothetical protein LOK49_LG05G00615 [Camellia lanceoleosa]|uniref:Uncharacterized protein n=1 Tax=Camellia lanceoleosa TaxID=1840588 RepID=A0ACC0HJJ5_9ERIC|nr:hypothetical protein LOK49_LG05G00615 [Camellia lanceoleosa]
MDDDVGLADIPPMRDHDMFDSSVFSVGSGPCGPSSHSSWPDCCDSGTDGGDGSKPKVGCINESGGRQFRGGKVSGGTFKREIQHRHKVRLGKNFLLIDRTLRQNLQSVGSFHFLHRPSLSIVALQPQGHSNPDMQLDEEASFPEVQMSPPVSDEVSPPIPSFSLSQDFDEQLPPLGLDSTPLPDPLSDSFMVFHAGGSKRIRAPRVGSFKSDAPTSAHFSRIGKVKAPRLGRSSRAPRSCSTHSRELCLGPLAGKRKRELRIEDCFNDPSLFRPPRRRAI